MTCIVSQSQKEEKKKQESQHGQCKQYFDYDLRARSILSCFYLGSGVQEGQERQENNSNASNLRSLFVYHIPDYIQE